MNYQSAFPLDIAEQIETAKNLLLTHTKRAYLVGGCVRDLLLGNEIHDVDIEVYDISPVEFDKIMKEAGAKGVGKSFYVYKYDQIDLALPRVERKVGQGHQAFEVQLCNDEKKASKRRDFTMNALMINIFDGKLLDFWGGKTDLERKQIKHINEEAFKEDSLRVLRAVQFAARFDLKIDVKSLHVMQGIDISDLSKTRIFWELEKFFKARYLQVGLRYFWELGLFEKLLGVHVDKKSLQDMQAELEDANFHEHLREYYLLYIICGILGLHVKDILQKLEVPNKYYRAFKNQPFFQNPPSDFELFQIAMKIPIKNWLGNYKEGITKRAKKLGIYEEIYTGGVNIQDVIKDGFEKEAIKEEYEKRVLESIKEKNSS